MRTAKWCISQRLKRPAGTFCTGTRRKIRISRANCRLRNRCHNVIPILTDSTRLVGEAWPADEDSGNINLHNMFQLHSFPPEKTAAKKKKPGQTGLSASVSDCFSDRTDSAYPRAHREYAFLCRNHRQSSDCPQTFCRH